jgi:hypothetical protein
MTDTDKINIVSPSTRRVINVLHKQFPKSMTIESVLVMLPHNSDTATVSCIKDELVTEMQKDPRIIEFGDAYAVVNYAVFIRMALWFMAILFSLASLMSGMEIHKTTDIACLMAAILLFFTEFF